MPERPRAPGHAEPGATRHRENCGVRAKRGPIDGLSFTIKS